MKANFFTKKNNREWNWMPNKILSCSNSALVDVVVYSQNIVEYLLQMRIYTEFLVNT
mgnify:CR=1 FL=1